MEKDLRPLSRFEVDKIACSGNVKRAPDFLCSMSRAFALQTCQVVSSSAGMLVCTPLSLLAQRLKSCLCIIRRVKNMKKGRTVPAGYQCCEKARPRPRASGFSAARAVQCLAWLCYCNCSSAAPMSARFARSRTVPNISQWAIIILATHFSANVTYVTLCGKT